MSTWGYSKRIDFFPRLQNQRGFTLIELIIVIIILGILAATITPKYLDLRSEALARAKEAAIGAVQSALIVAISKNAVKRPPVSEVHPTVTELAENVDGGTDLDNGIEVTIDNTSYTVGTHTNISGQICKLLANGSCDITKCIPTTAKTDIVWCVGGIT